MADDTPEDADLPPGRAKRAPPTIDLEASEVTTESGNASDDAPPEGVAEAAPAPISPWVIAPVSGAVAAALVIAVGWMLGWPAVPAVAPAAPPASAAVIDDLATRLANIESRQAKASVPDPVISGRVEAIEKSLASLRAELVGVRAQLDKLAAAPREGSAAPDLTVLNERLGQLERAVRAQEAASESAKAADAKATDAKAADDVPLRRVVAAALLDLAVRQGDPYAAALASAKSLAANPDALKPLDGFAATGVPHHSALSRELLALVPKLSPRAEENAGSGLVDRLQAGAAKLVRIERTDQAGNDRGAIVARATAAALRNDFAVARRELNTLPPADRTAAQPWLDKADARDAALAASRQFATDAMAALAKPAQ